MTEDNLHGTTTTTTGNDPSCSPMSLVSSGNHHHSSIRLSEKFPVPIGCSNSSSSKNLIIRPLVDIIDGKILRNGEIIGPIPNLFKWLQTELNRVEKNLESGFPVVKNSPETVVELALTKEEQNLEIIFYNDQYYFEVIRSFRIDQKNDRSKYDSEYGEEKPKAWFCNDIEDRFSVRPAQTWINGKELFCCLMCNHFSFYHNHLLLHIMLDCPRKNGGFNNDSRPTENRNGESKRPRIDSADDRKQPRSFDIISLLNRNNDHSNHHQENNTDDDDDDEMVDVETLEEETTSNQTFRTSNSKIDPFPGKSKIRNSTICHSSKYQPVRRYATNNGNKKMASSSSLSIMGNSKSAFRKLGTPSSSRSKKAAVSIPQPPPPPPPSSSTSFISNLQLSNFYRQLASPDTGPTSSSAATNPLFTNTFANLFGNRNPTGSHPSPPPAPAAPLPPPSSSFITDQSSLYPFRSDPNQSNKNGKPFESSSTTLFEPTTSGAIVTASGSSLESTSPPLSESSGQSSPGSEKKDNHHTGSKILVQDDLSSDSSPMIQLLPQSAQTTMANNPLFNLPPYFMPPTSAAANNPLITSLYLLSPSLTALSYQASNVCAYCNTAFRMTSDLVYHMRSHHKKTRMDDSANKKRRDDQLRCHICQETFRERHHLTRHMTSHQ